MHFINLAIDRHHSIWCRPNLMLESKSLDARVSAAQKEASPNSTCQTEVRVTQAHITQARAHCWEGYQWSFVARDVRHGLAGASVHQTCPSLHGCSFPNILVAALVGRGKKVKTEGFPTAHRPVHPKDGWMNEQMRTCMHA
eukprot:scaffold307329_cov23-Tisochrysis_lutea.AAC.1